MTSLMVIIEIIVMEFHTVCFCETLKHVPTAHMSIRDSIANLGLR